MAKAIVPLAKIDHNDTEDKLGDNFRQDLMQFAVSMYVFV